MKAFLMPDPGFDSLDIQPARQTAEEHQRLQPSVLLRFAIFHLI